MRRAARGEAVESKMRSPPDLLGQAGGGGCAIARVGEYVDQLEREAERITVPGTARGSRAAVRIHRHQYSWVVRARSRACSTLHRRRRLVHGPRLSLRSASAIVSPARMRQRTVGPVIAHRRLQADMQGLAVAVDAVALGAKTGAACRWRSRRAGLNWWRRVTAPVRHSTMRRRAGGSRADAHGSRSSPRRWA